MGQEVACTARWGGKSVRGKALLETAEIVFRGDPRLKIPLSSIRGIAAVDGELRLKTDAGAVVFKLGERAEKWRQKILNPKSVLEKLGVKAGEVVAVFGNADADFIDKLRAQGSSAEREKLSMGTGWIFLFVDVADALSEIKKLAGKIQGSTALWVVYPKGQKTITENDVLAAGRKAGLKDVKVVGFSATHTALKFVLPVEKR